MPDSSPNRPVPGVDLRPDITPVLRQPGEIILQRRLLPSHLDPREAWPLLRDRVSMMFTLAAEKARFPPKGALKGSPEYERWEFCHRLLVEAEKRKEALRRPKVEVPQPEPILTGAGVVYDFRRGARQTYGRAYPEHYNVIEGSIDQAIRMAYDDAIAEEFAVADILGEILVHYGVLGERAEYGVVVSAHSMEDVEGKIASAPALPEGPTQTEKDDQYVVDDQAADADDWARDFARGEGQ